MALHCLLCIFLPAQINFKYFPQPSKAIKKTKISFIMTFLLIYRKTKDISKKRILNIFIWSSRPEVREGDGVKSVINYRKKRATHTLATQLREVGERRGEKFGRGWTMPEIDGVCLRFYSRWLTRRGLASIGFGFNL